MLGEAVSRDCDAYITGDVKHDVWIDAYNSGITLFDCGHFHTEDIVIPYITEKLLEMFPEIKITQAEADVDPVNYI